MDALTVALTRSPRFLTALGELQEYAAQERERRARFYEEITPECKWEFINGEVIMHSPALLRHLMAQKRILNLLNNWVTLNRLGVALGEKALVALTRNDYEPDVVFFRTEKAGDLHPNTLLFPAPDFVVEVLSDSTMGRDRGIKYEDYAAHGVAEYWIVDPVIETIERHVLQGEVYRLAEKRNDGTLRCGPVPGWEFPVRAAFDDEVNLHALAAMLGNRPPP